MHTKESLLRDLEKSGIDKNGALLVHSSLKAVGESENGANTILDAFMEFMKDGLLIFPAHTWKTVNRFIPNRVYDPKTEPSCVGALTELFRQRPGVLRSLHTSHSVAAIGNAFGCGAAEYVSGEEKAETPCGRQGCWGKLLDLKAQILFLGCTLRSNTFLHGVEEWNDIPNRLTEEKYEFFIKTDKETIPVSTRCHFQPQGLDVSENYIKMQRVFTEKGACREILIGSAVSFLCDAEKMNDITTRCLKKDPDLFAKSEPLSEDAYA